MYTKTPIVDFTITPTVNIIYYTTPTHYILLKHPFQLWIVGSFVFPTTKHRFSWLSLPFLLFTIPPSSIYSLVVGSFSWVVASG